MDTFATLSNILIAFMSLILMAWVTLGHGRISRLGSIFGKLSPTSHAAESSFSLSKSLTKIIMTALIVIFYFEFVLLGGFIVKWGISLLNLSIATDQLALSYTMLGALTLAAVIAFLQGNPLITYAMASYNLGATLLLWDQTGLIALPAAITAIATFGLLYFQKHELPSVARESYSPAL